MATVTLAELRTRARQRSNTEHTGSDNVTDAELTQLVNSSNAELHGLLARASILSTAEDTHTISTNGSASYALPADLAIIANVYRVEGNENIPLERHSVRLIPSATTMGPPVSYRATNSTIEFNNLSSGYTVKVLYLTEATLLVDDTDTVDYDFGWEEYIVVCCAINIAIKEENWSLVEYLRGERERILNRIKDEATAQEMTQSYAISRGGRRGLPGDYQGAVGYRGDLSNLPYWMR